MLPLRRFRLPGCPNRDAARLGTRNNRIAAEIAIEVPERELVPNSVDEDEAVLLLRRLDCTPDHAAVFGRFDRISREEFLRAV